MRLLKSFYCKIKWALQRAFRGYDDRAYGQLDWYIAKIALPVLFEHLENFDEGYPVGLTPRQWHKIIMKMIDGLLIVCPTSLLFDKLYLQVVHHGSSLEKSSPSKKRVGLQLFLQYLENL